MMRTKARKLAMCSLAMIALLSVTTGCWPEAIFGLGYLLGSTTNSTQTTCLLNGEPVDCNTLPETSP